MPRCEVAILRTGTANIASVAAAFERLGVCSAVVSHAAIAREARVCVLPGVGAFGAAMQALDQGGLADAVRDRIDRDRPLLAICLGMQLLAEESEESPGVRGLAVVPARVTRFQASCRVPHFGWNDVCPEAGCEMLERGEAYFANSFRLVDAPTGWNVAMTTHGEPFVAAMERRNVLACQFHPELSGAWGAALLSRWLERAGAWTC